MNARLGSRRVIVPPGLIAIVAIGVAAIGSNMILNLSAEGVTGIENGAGTGAVAGVLASIAGIRIVMDQNELTIVDLLDVYRIPVGLVSGAAWDGRLEIELADRSTILPDLFARSRYVPRLKKRNATAAVDSINAWLIRGAGSGAIGVLTRRRRWEVLLYVAAFAAIGSLIALARAI